MAYAKIYRAEENLAEKATYVFAVSQPGATSYAAFTHTDTLHVGIEEIRKLKRRTMIFSTKPSKEFSQTFDIRRSFHQTEFHNSRSVT